MLPVMHRILGLCIIRVMLSRSVRRWLSPASTSKIECVEMPSQEPTKSTPEFINDKLTSAEKWVAGKTTFTKTLAVSFFCVALLSLLTSLICRVSLFNYCKEFEIRYPFEGVPFAQLLVTVVSVFAWLLLKIVLSQLYSLQRAIGERNRGFLLFCVVAAIPCCHFQFYAWGTVLLLLSFCFVANAASGEAFCGFDLWLLFSGASAILVVLVTLIPILISETESRNEFLRLTGYGGGQNVVVAFEESGGAEQAKVVEGCLLLRTNTSIFLVPWGNDRVRIECPIDHVREIRYPKNELEDKHKSVLSSLGFKYHEEKKGNCGSKNWQE